MGYFLSPGLSENLILLSSQVNGSLIEDKIIGQNLCCQNPGGVSHWLWEFKVLKEEFEDVIFFFSIPRRQSDLFHPGYHSFLYM